MKVNEERLGLWSLLLGPQAGHPVSSSSTHGQPDVAPGERPGKAGPLAFSSDSCSSVTCRATSNSLYHVAQPVLPLVPFRFVLSLEECLGMIHPPSPGAGSHPFYYLTLSFSLPHFLSPSLLHSLSSLYGLSSMAASGKSHFFARWLNTTRVNAPRSPGFL